MKLYAFITPDIAKHAGCLKIGETHGNVEERVKQQGHELNVENEIVWTDAVITERIGIDKMIHRYLKEQGFHVQQFGTGRDTEWVKCTLADLEKAFAVVKQRLYDEEKQREEIGKQFYLEIRNWFYWTTQENKKIDNDYALRLVVRLLFCFFLREKNELVPKELLDANITAHLKNDEEYSYYNGILRNLFFHCLNTPGERKYENEKLLVAQNIKKWFTVIPFLNGGLFDEHDKDDIPIGNDYFFSERKERTLTELDRTCDVYGIITILSKYQYKLTLDDLLEQAEYETVDPEFIGKVFESLLSCIDSNSKESRRKVTGSYYTPREIVDYMVNTSLDAYLETKRQTDTQSSDSELLLQCRILDPACGSGAFPCEAVNIIMHRIEEEKKLRDNKSLSPLDRYHIKLNIVRNVIYGVDIQPMAVQITLLRFFLSLIQEITPNKQDKNNYGIVPLPNLEVKFVCADTLIPLVTDRKDSEGRYQRMLENPIIRNTTKSLLDNRNQYFMASMLDRKQEIRQIDKTLRETLAIAMESDGMITHNTTKKIMAWNPYDQSQSAPFFDTGWMFGIRGGFDIVIGNPPYDVLGTKHPHLGYYRKNFRSTSGGKVNLYELFFEKGLSLIKDNGLLVYITPYNYLTSADSVKLREILLNETTIIEIVDYEESQKVFESATQAVATIITRKQPTRNYQFEYRNLGTTYTLKSKEVNRAPRLLFKGSNRVIKRINQWEKTFDYFIEGYQGEINVSTKKDFFVDNNQKGCLPLIRGNQIGHYETISQPVEFCPINISSRSHHKIRRIVFQEIANAGQHRRIKATILENVLCGHTVNYMFSKHKNLPLEALLGLINSRLINYYFKFYNQTNHVPIGEIKMIPVPDCIVSTSKRLAKLVTRRLQGELVDDKIDALVYELYGLTDEEIRLVEKQ